MKKTIFSALAVIAIVTSALAFTTKSTDVVFCANPDNQNFCDLPTNFSSLIDHHLGSAQKSCVAASQEATCPAITIYKTNL